MIKIKRESRGEFSKRGFGLKEVKRGIHKLSIQEDFNGSNWAEWDINNRKFIIIYTTPDLAVFNHQAVIMFNSKPTMVSLHKVSVTR